MPENTSAAIPNQSAEPKSPDEFPDFRIRTQAWAVIPIRTSRLMNAVSSPKKIRARPRPSFCICPFLS